MQAIHGNPHYRLQPEQADGLRQTATTHPTGPAKPGTAGRAVVVKVELSAAAQELVSPTGPGKSGNSPAHQARSAIEAHPELADLPFGQVVKAINHNTLDSLLAPVEEPVADETVAPAETEQPAPVADVPEVAETEDLFTGLVDEVVTDTESDDPAAPETAPEPNEALSDEATAEVAMPKPVEVDVTDELLAAIDASGDAAIIDRMI